jgi:hypothetical protein
MATIRACEFCGSCFLAPFVFFDLVDQLQASSKNKYQGYQFQHASMYVSLLFPIILYAFTIFFVLIGSIFVMAPFGRVLNSPFNYRWPPLVAMGSLF